jgi:glutathione S-transferase
VPVLVHNGVGLAESASITQYLERHFPERSLCPSGSLAAIEAWTLWCDAELKPDIDLYKYRWDALSAEEKQALSLRLRSYLEKLASALRKDFLLGAELSLADIHVFPFYRQLQKARAEFLKEFSFPVVEQWLERIISRPSFERVMAKPIKPA